MQTMLRLGEFHLAISIMENVPFEVSPEEPAILVEAQIFGIAVRAENLGTGIYAKR